jgi:thiol-disulfide isomerase/thioredoxin
MLRRAWWLWLPGAAVLVVVVAIGLHQAPESHAPATAGASPLSPREVAAKLGGSPPALAALHREANAFLPGQRDGLRARLRALRGHPVVVNVWAAWCGPCRDELPIFQRASLEWGRRVAFLGVDYNDNREAARRLLGKVPLTYPSFDDPDGRIVTAYRLTATPSTVFYDARGRQTVIHIGPYLTRADLDRHIARYALGRPA